MKNFESNIKYDEKAKRYKVGLPWKLEARELKDNREIAEKRFTRLRKRFQKNPHLFLEYREVLQNFLKQGIIELFPNSDSDSNNVTFYLPHREVIRKDRLSSLDENPDFEKDNLPYKVLEAERFWIQVEPEKFFPEELKSLKDYKIEKESPLYNYMSYLDENGLIRLGGRLEFCNLSIDEKHHLILPKNSSLTTLIVRREHNKVVHGETASTLAQVRSNYWIPKGRQLVKKVIRNCFVFRKYLAKPIDHLTSPIPSDCINQTPAFSVCGLDFAGPLYVNNFGELQKSYIVLFTCGVTRALHLEMVSDMTTNSFLLAFRRFLARGSCKWGEYYERLVRSVKESLHKILGKALLSFEEMTTILTEIEDVLNLRPLSYVYEENDEPIPLTPMHFLNFGQNEPTYPVTFAEILENASTKSSLLKRKKY
ncbi:uncharacterized protein TNIN_71421 [Trichonephila inaurata madagascariensis]|uniref:Integrase zinc-binding domain-containing protein n=1 Tax=Trichonephila inaurata madagascariensis TaxID=2747483 RepID=A0A8X7BUI9_9ARAC|nr:uncharacterized protein TNIN_196081 [Trichonephila inaurata madagascariensis]GFY43668.1 uncharacterized protein TNIN_71421 [Trichonephila inaurata madagascariensis]